MKKNLLKDLEKKLLFEKEFLKQEIEKLEKFPSLGDGTLCDEKEADEAEEYSTYLALKDVFEKRLKKVEEALQRIKQGNFGICQNCQKEIEIEKLLADPTTSLCKKCAQEK